MFAFIPIFLFVFFFASNESVSSIENGSIGGWVKPLLFINIQKIVCYFALQSHRTLRTCNFILTAKLYKFMNVCINMECLFVCSRVYACLTICYFASFCNGKSYNRFGCKFEEARAKRMHTPMKSILLIGFACQENSV